MGISFYGCSFNINGEFLQSSVGAQFAQGYVPLNF